MVGAVDGVRAHVLLQAVEVPGQLVVGQPG